MSRRQLVTAIVALFFFAEVVPLIPNPCAAQFSDREKASDLAAFVPTGTLKEEYSFQAYTIRIYGDPMFKKGGSFEILQRGRRVYGKNGWEFWIGSPGDKKASMTPIGKNITGNGVPNLVISEFSGGAHCCFKTFVFEIGRRFQEIAKLGAEEDHSSYARFTDFDGDGILEFVTYDWTFQYWRTSFADSPAPQVILRYRNGTYRIADDLMRKPAPLSMELASRARKIQQVKWGAPCLAAEGFVESVLCGTAGYAPCRYTEYPCPPSNLWGTMLDLLYTGQAALAWQFLEMAWPLRIQGKDKFLTDFRTQLTQSPYWPDVHALSQPPTKQGERGIADIKPFVREKQPTVATPQRTSAVAEEIPLLSFA
jgi:hypothetical protein